MSFESLLTNPLIVGIVGIVLTFFAQYWRHSYKKIEEPFNKKQALGFSLITGIIIGALSVVLSGKNPINERILTDSFE